jgi:hypothetical protein
MATIIINEKTNGGKILMAIARAIKKTNANNIQVLSDERMEDFLLGKIMEETATGEYVSENEIMQILQR